MQDLLTIVAPIANIVMNGGGWGGGGGGGLHINDVGHPSVVGMVEG